MDDDDLRERLDRLDLEREVHLLTGAHSWSLHPEPAVGLRRLWSPTVRRAGRFRLHVGPSSGVLPLQLDVRVAG